jgi:Beta-propeller repeat
VITGFTYGSLGGANQGLNDAFIVKYSAAGDRLWKRQLGTAEYDWSNGVATDGEGNIVIGGWTNGALGGRNRGDDDAFVAKFRP